MSYSKDDWIDDFIFTAMFAAFVVGDLATTAFGLYNGYIESAPFAYVFGSFWITVMAWLVVQKLAFLWFLQWIVGKAYHSEYKNPLKHFAYGVLFAYGLAVTLQNLRYLA